jgi:putative transposase
MVLSPAGSMVSNQWSALASAFPDVTIEHQIVMPNHVHAIVGLGLDVREAAERTSLPVAMHWYKSTTTNLYIKGVHAGGWPRFDGHLWQPGYHDHIVRTERELDRLWSYIDSNPAQWQRDAFFV